MKHKIICGDCIEVMDEFKNKTIDMILCDLPYGTTACSWDTIIPFEPLWKQYKRIIKDNGAIVLTASQPFTSLLVISNINWFKYEWIWEKENGGNFATSNFQPLRIHENVLIFGEFATSYRKNGIYNYNKQFRNGKAYIQISGNPKFSILHDGKMQKQGGNITNNTGYRFPSSIIKFNRDRGLHPTQKPVSLFEYLIKTYTNEDDLILDNCVGSGTTLIASERLKRNSIGIEILKEYCQLSYKRLIEEIEQTKLSGELSTIERIGF